MKCYQVLNSRGLPASSGGMKDLAIYPDLDSAKNWAEFIEDETGDVGFRIIAVKVELEYAR